MPAPVTIPQISNTWTPLTVPTDAYWEAGSASQPMGSGSAKLLVMHALKGGLNIQAFGAKADSGTTDNTTIIQGVIALALAAKIPVYVPGSTGYYKITAPLTVAGDGLIIYGDGRSSRIHNTGTDDALQIGNGGGTTYRENQVRNIYITGGDTSHWGINVNKSYDTLITDVKIDVSSTVYGAIIYQQSAGGLIFRNIIGNLKGSGIKVTNASAATNVCYNRIDGASVAAGTGLSLNGRSLTAWGNTVQTLLVGTDLAGVGALKYFGYHEDCVTALKDSAISSGVEIQGEFQAHTTSTHSIKLLYTDGATIRLCNFSLRSHTSGYAIKLSAADGARNIVIGQNSLNASDAEVEMDSRFADANFVIESEAKHFRPFDYFRNTFSTWAAGTASAPGVWDNSAGTLARRSDAPFGRYGLDLIGAASRINRRVLNISATENADVRGRWCVFSIFAKTISGDDTFRLVVTDGVNTVQLDNSAAAAWGRWAVGIQVSPTATFLEVSVTKLVGGTACFAAPSFYVGTTSAPAPVQDEVDRVPASVDATVGTKTGSAGETTFKTVTIPGRTLGTQGAFRIRAAGTASGTAAEKVAQIYFGGTLIGKIFEDVADQKNWLIDITVINRTAAAQTVSGIETPSTTGTLIGVRCSDITVDTTIDRDVTLTLLLNSAADTITVKSFSVEPIFNP